MSKKPKKRKSLKALKKRLKTAKISAKASIVILIIAVSFLAAALWIIKWPRSASRSAISGGTSEEEEESVIEILKIYSEEHPEREIAYWEGEDGLYVNVSTLNAYYMEDELFFDTNEGKIFHTTLAKGKQVLDLGEYPTQDIMGELYIRLDEAAELFSFTVEEVSDLEIRLHAKEREEEPEPELPAEYPEAPIVLSWYQDYSSLFNEEKTASAQRSEGVANVWSPTWYTLDEEGQIQSYVNEEWVTFAHDHGCQVWALVGNEGYNERALKAIQTEEGRDQLIQYLVEQYETLGLDGFNIDFETLSKETAPYYVEFVREAAAVLRPMGCILSIDVSPPQAWSYYYRRDLLARAVDYSIVMAYDEHYGGGEAGSVSSMEFTKLAIMSMLEMTDSDHLILGIPFYTRIWYVEESGETTSEAWSMNKVETYLEENKLKPEYDSVTGQDYVSRTVDGVLEEIWIENEKSIRQRAAMAKEYQLAGVGCWKSGLEKEDTWTWIQEELK